MSIGNFNPTAVAPIIERSAPISSEVLNAFFSAITSDLSTLSGKFNKMVSIVSGVDSTDNTLDGKNILVDKDATESKDNGLLFFSDTSKPITIYEAFLLFIQILSNMENGLKEGVRVGSVGTPVDISTEPTFTWPYVDGMFEAFLFTNTNDGIARVSPDIIVKNQILTISGTGTAYGYIWHPILTLA